MLVVTRRCPPATQATRATTNHNNNTISEGFPGQGRSLTCPTEVAHLRNANIYNQPIRPDNIFLFRFPPTNPCDPTSSTETKTSAISLSKTSKVMVMMFDGDQITSEMKLHPCTTSSSRLPPQPSPPPKAPSPFTDDSFSEDYGSLPFTPRSYPPPFILPRTR